MDNTFLQFESPTPPAQTQTKRRHSQPARYFETSTSTPTPTPQSKQYKPNKSFGSFRYHNSHDISEYFSESMLEDPWKNLVQKPQLNTETLND